MSRKWKLWLIQQGVWDIESMPLAAGYLKAAALAREIIRSEIDIRIFSFKGSDSIRYMAKSLYFEEIPDIVAFSTYGWNFNKFGALAETFRQINPSGWIVFGGPHVTNQAERVFRLYPQVDIIINGEGEITFPEVLSAYIARKSKYELYGIEGISFKQDDKIVITTPPRPVIEDLDTIPSPFLTNTIELINGRGGFKYDAALLETNRGCPHNCAFCSWSNDTQKKVRFFSRERLHAEIELLAYHKAPSIVLCDSNFGMFKDDELFIDDLIRIKEKYCYPCNLEASWSKNKSTTFFNIARKMKLAGLQSSFTLALQTLNSEALTVMNRSNMGFNNYLDTVKWLKGEGFDCFIELIWGAPGETSESFIQGYDQLSEFVPRISVYPLLILPNTHYSENRDEYGLVTVRNNKDDFEYVLSHRTINIEDNHQIYRFLFWARLIVENMVFRNIWLPVRKLTSLTQSQVLLSLDRWIEQRSDEASLTLKGYRSKIVNDFDISVISEALHYIYSDSPNLSALFHRWWNEELLPLIPIRFTDFLSEIFRYDQLTWPIYYIPGDSKVKLPGDIKIILYNDEQYYVREKQKFFFNIPSILEGITCSDELAIERKEIEFSIYYKSGFYNYIDNQEFTPLYIGKARLNEEPNIKIG
jgi:radical SAM superfamily enzyme YgiQ (UPF0313 family)